MPIKVDQDLSLKFFIDTTQMKHILILRVMLFDYQTKHFISKIFFETSSLCALLLVFSKIFANCAAQKPASRHPCGEVNLTVIDFNSSSLHLRAKNSTNRVNCNRSRSPDVEAISNNNNSANIPFAQKSSCILPSLTCGCC